MSLAKLRETAREIIRRLALEDYDSVVRRCVESRLTGGELRSVIVDSGRRLGEPPNNAYDRIDAARSRMKGTEQNERDVALHKTYT
jgi:hypothetical protein